MLPAEEPVDVPVTVNELEPGLAEPDITEHGTVTVDTLPSDPVLSVEQIDCEAPLETRLVPVEAGVTVDAAEVGAVVEDDTGPVDGLVLPIVHGIVKVDS